MEQIASYILSVICGAILCGIVSRIPLQDTAGKKLIQTVCGIFMVFTLIKPLAGIVIRDPMLWLEDFSAEAKDVASQGQAQTNIALRQSIKCQLESYILDKAATLGAMVDVQILLSEEGMPVPIGAVLCGDVSPYHKAQLRAILEADLGILGENQIWQ